MNCSCEEDESEAYFMSDEGSVHRRRRHKKKAEKEKVGKSENEKEKITTIE